VSAAGDRVKTTGPGGAGRRSAARLAAVQALYQIEIGGAAPAEVIAQFLAGERPEPEAEDRGSIVLPEPDARLFAALVEGVIAVRPQLDAAIARSLATDWTVERLEILVRIILEAGVFELTSMPDIPPKVSINEYVNVAHAFFGGAEPGLINGVLDAVAGAAGASPVPREGA